MEKLAVVLLSVGILIIITMNIAYNPIKLNAETIQHVAKDLTIELAQHLYLLGILLIIFGTYKIIRKPDR